MCPGLEPALAVLQAPTEQAFILVLMSTAGETEGAVQLSWLYRVPQGCPGVPGLLASHTSYRLFLHNLLPRVPNPGNSGVSRHTWGVAGWECGWLTELNVL